MTDHPASHSPEEATRAPASRRTGALLLAAAWCATLAILTFAAANPVTPNREQLLRAPLVVIARVEDAARDTATVESRWRGQVSGEIRVTNLSETGVKNGQSYILPLVRVADNEFEIVPARLPKRPWLVYPATPAAIDQVAAILGSSPE